MGSGVKKYGRINIIMLVTLSEKQSQKLKKLKIIVNNKKLIIVL